MNTNEFEYKNSIIMIKDINFNAVSLGALFKMVLLALILGFLIFAFFHFVKITNTVAQTRYVIFLCSSMVIICAIFLRLHEKIISFSFNNDELIIHGKYSARTKSIGTSRAIPYNKIKSYNIFSVRFFTKKVGDVVRITSDKNYVYCSSSVSGNKKDEFSQDEYNRLKKILSQDLKLRKIKKPIDRLLILSFSIIPQIISILGVLLLIGIFWYIFSL